VNVDEMRLRASSLAPACLLELWAVEYSSRQRAFHVHQVNEMLEVNTAHITAGLGSAPDYVPVGFAYSHDEATAIRKRVQALQEER